MTKSKIARLSKEALEDTRLGPMDLAFLFYLMNSEELKAESFTVEQVTDRFHRKRGWFPDEFNKLIRLGYAKRTQKNDPETGHTVTLYAVADIPGVLDDPRIAEQLFANTKQKLKRIYEPVRTTQPGPRVSDVPDRHPPTTPKRSPYPPANTEYKPHHTKFMNTATMSQADLELSNFYAQYGFAMPKTAKEWEEARKPGIRAWAEVTETPLDWQAARLLNKRLIEPINKKALEIAWERWTSTSYRKERAIGVIEWYEELCLDITATPWDTRQTKRRKANVKGRPVRRPDKQHGKASAEYKEEDFSAI